MAFSDAFANVYGTIKGAHARDQQLAMEQSLQPLRQQLMELQVQSGRYENDVLAPLNKQIADLQLEQGQLNLGTSRRQARYDKWAQEQQASMLARFPALSVAGPIEELAHASTLNAEAESYKASVKKMQEESAQNQQVIDHFTKKRDAASASLLQTRQLVDTTLSAISDQNPGFTVTERERSGMYDAAARAIDSGQVDPSQVPDLLSSYMGSLPRFQRRLDALPAIEAAAVGAPAGSAQPQTSAAQQLQQLQQTGVQDLSGAFKLYQAQQAAQTESKAQAMSAKKKGILDWLTKVSIENPGVALPAFQQAGITDPAALNGLDIDALGALQNTIAQRALQSSFPQYK